MTIFEFNVTLDDLLYAIGAEGLNEILEERMSESSTEDFEGVIPTDISYETVGLADEGDITIRATFTPVAYGDDY